MGGRHGGSDWSWASTTHMIAGSRACSTSTRSTHPTITNQTSPHYDEALWGLLVLCKG